jgi:hypothetical protein
VFRHIPLTCTWACPQFAHFDLNKEALNDFYGFLGGPSTARRTPTPSLAVTIIAKRKAGRAWSPRSSLRRRRARMPFSGQDQPQRLDNLHIFSLQWMEGRKTFEHGTRSSFLRRNGSAGKHLHYLFLRPPLAPTNRTQPCKTLPNSPRRLLTAHHTSTGWRRGLNAIASGTR